METAMKTVKMKIKKSKMIGETVDEEKRSSSV